MALADIAALQAQGLHPTPEDIIRLNGLALAAERCGDPDAANNAPRVVWLGNVAIHEPTLQAQIWLSEVADRVAGSDGAYDTLRVYACAHGRIPGFFTRPSMRNSAIIKVRVYAWATANLWKTTPRQIAAALMYVCTGDDPVDGEYPDLTGAHPNRLRHTPCSHEDRLNRMIHAALAAGITLPDSECLTWSAANNILDRAWRANGGQLKDMMATPLGDYTLTLSNIELRLKSEKKV
jgi:hypothetical protein